MGTFGTPSSYNNTGALGGATNPTTAQGLSRDRENQKAILELPGTQAWVEKTITDGVIIPTSAEIIVMPEGGASTDSLTTIALTSDGTTTLHEGMPIRLKAANSNTITVVHGTGANNISTIDGNNVVLDTTWYLELKLINGLWVQQETHAYKTASTPATTTSRGIGRVATLADMKPGATVTNGPAVIDAKGGVITTTPTAHAVPQADAYGTLNNWFGGVYDYIDNALLRLQPPPITGSATLNGTTDNTVQLTDIVTTLGLEVGDVIRIQYSGYDKLHTVESITDDNSIIVNYEHAGNRGNGSLKLADQTAAATITRIAKWYNAPDGIGQGWVYVLSSRSSGTTYPNSTKRSIKVLINKVDTQSLGLTIGTKAFQTDGANNTYGEITIPAGLTYSYTGNIVSFVELR